MSVRKAPSAKYSVISSSCASTVTQLVMVPCETIKIQLQIFQKNRIHGESALISSLKSISKKEGIMGFWKGYFVSLGCSLPSTSIYYFLFESFRRRLYSELNSDSKVLPLVPALAGCSSQFLTCLAVSPLDRFRTQLWGNRSLRFRDIWRNTALEVNQHGYRTLYHGLKPMMIRDVLFSGIYWSIYESLRSKIDAFGLSPIVQNFVAASIGGMVTTAIVTPFDLVKTRQQVLNESCSVFTSMRQIIQEEGVYGLFRGITPRILQIIPTMSIMMILYDGLNRVFLKRESMQLNPTLYYFLSFNKQPYSLGLTSFRICPHLGQMYV